NHAGRAQALALDIEGEIERPFGKARSGDALGQRLEPAAFDIGAHGELGAIAARREIARCGKLAAEETAFQRGDAKPVFANRSGERGSLDLNGGTERKRLGLESDVAFDLLEQSERKTARRPKLGRICADRSQ